MRRLMDIWEINPKLKQITKTPNVKPGRIIAYPRGETAQVPPTSNFPLKSPRPLFTPDSSCFTVFLLIITRNFNHVCWFSSCCWVSG